jgi:hypothetical protein
MYSTSRSDSSINFILDFFNRPFSSEKESSGESKKNKEIEDLKRRLVNAEDLRILQLEQVEALKSSLIRLKDIYHSKNEDYAKAISWKYAVLDAASDIGLSLDPYREKNGVTTPPEHYNLARLVIKDICTREAEMALDSKISIEAKNLSSSGAIDLALDIFPHLSAISKETDKIIDKLNTLGQETLASLGIENAEEAQSCFSK